MTEVGEAIERRRELAGLTQEQLAERAGVSLSALGKWERGERQPRRQYLEMLARVLRCTAADLAAGRLPEEPDIPADFDDAPRGRPVPLLGEPGDGVPMMRINELDVSAAAGFEHGLDIENHYEGAPEPIVAEWQMPRDLVHGITAALPSHLRIIRIKGISMVPDYMPGERVLVDLQDRTPSPAGPFVLWDGLNLVVKHLELMPGSDPPKIRLISVNKTFGTYEQPLADLHINGRVIGKWQWS